MRALKEADTREPSGFFADTRESSGLFIADEVCPTPPQTARSIRHLEHIKIMSRDMIFAVVHDLVHLVFPEPGPIFPSPSIVVLVHLVCPLVQS